MPVQVPNLDDRDFEQLLAEAKQRIGIYTREWSNFEVESDPGITLVQLFAFLTDSLLYRANRIPERDRLKFLQLLGIPLKPAAAAQGILAIQNEKAGLTALSLDAGIPVSAGQVGFLTRDAVTVLPLEVKIYFKKSVSSGDTQRNAELRTKYQAVLTALQATDATVGTDTTLTFYETMPMPQPLPGNPNPLLDLKKDTLDQAVYVALLAPENMPKEEVRALIGRQTLSLGIAPAETGKVDSLAPVRRDQKRRPLAGLVYEVPDVTPGANGILLDHYQRLQPTMQSNVLDDVGIVQLDLSQVNTLDTWQFESPLQEGTRDFPPRLEDERLRDRVITWLRIRVPQQTDPGVEIPEAALRWIGINATRIQQAIPIRDELLGMGSGEPDQILTAAGTPIIENSVRLRSRTEQGEETVWRLTDDLLSADANDRVFTLDAQSGEIRFGDGLRGWRPERNARVFLSYSYGGGRQGNVGIGAVNATSDSRLQGGFRLTNPIPTWGGDRGETEAEAERNAPLVLRHRDRLVTAQDFEDVTRSTPGVDIGRVEILPLYHPKKSEDAAGVVTVLVIPETDPIQPLWPVPSRTFLRTVCAYLDARRMITSEIFVQPPKYVPVYVSVGVQIMEGYFRDTVIQAVGERLKQYLSSLPPGGNAGEGWALNRRLHEEELKAVVTRVAGVDYVDSLFLGVEGGRNELRGLELPLLAGLRVVEGAAEPLASLMQPAVRPGVAKTVPVPISKAKC